MLFTCACSRETVRRNAEAAGRPLLYSGTCRELGLDAEAAGHSWRCRVRGSVNMRDVTGQAGTLHPGELMGDFVVRQKTGDPSYQLTSVVDDEDLGINFVVRGMDLLPSTAAQMVLADGLGFGNFTQARVWHHSLCIDDAGEKLSKSADAESLRALRQKFPDPSPVFRFFGKQLGLNVSGLTTGRELLPGFDPSRVATIPWKLSDFWREIEG
jgi:glutamyl-tRNA synthetase